LQVIPWFLKFSSEIPALSRPKFSLHKNTEE